MLSQSEAESKVLSEYPDRTIDISLFHKTFWFVQARSTDSEEGSMNPYFKVDASTGKLTEFSPAMNPSEFSDIMVSAQEV